MAISCHSRPILFRDHVEMHIGDGHEGCELPWRSAVDMFALATALWLCVCVCDDGRNRKTFLISTHYHLVVFWYGSRKTSWQRARSVCGLILCWCFQRAAAVWICSMDREYGYRLEYYRNMAEIATRCDDDGNHI